LAVREKKKKRRAAFAGSHRGDEAGRTLGKGQFSREA